jgi:hypothetical protein
MGSITGNNTNMGLKIATVWGTPTAAGSGDRFAAEYSPDLGASYYQGRSIGSGLAMQQESVLANSIPVVGLTGDLGYRNGWDRIFAVFFGSAPAPTQVTVGQGDYKHVISLIATLPTTYLCYATESTSTTTHEYPTCTVRSIGIKSSSVPGPLDATCELLAGIQNRSSATNTNATLASTTWTEGTPELAAINFDDYLWIDDQSTSALSSADLYAIEGFDFKMSRPQEIRAEMKGSLGNSVPKATGPVEGSVTFNVAELADHTYYTVWAAETAKKALITCQGSQIGTGTNKQIALYIPRIKMSSGPGYAITDPGTNKLTLEWAAYGASSNPTGMNSKYPYLEITNTLATSLLA